MKERYRVLLVEDDEVDRIAFERFIKRKHLTYDYKIVGSISEARDALVAEHFDAVLVDYLLGDGTAFDLFGMVGDAPIVVITGSGDEGTAVEAMKAGATDYLIKDPEGHYLTTLPVTVESAIGRRRAEEELRRYRDHLEELVAERTAELAQANEQLLAEIAEREQVEESRMLLVAAIEQTAEAILIVDTLGIVRYANSAFGRITGYTPQDVVGQSLDKFEGEMNNVSFYQDAWRALARGEAWGGNLVSKRKDGSPYESEVTISPVRDASGQVTNYIIVQRDVTKEIALEARLRQMQKMEAIGRLAGGVAHDFNNMLTAILGYAEFILNDLAPGDPVRADLDEIIEAASRAADLTSQLLAFSRKQVLQLQVLDLNAVIVNMEKMLRRLIGEDVDLFTVLDPALGRVMADPGQIEQVLMNLSINARDAMPQGGRLTVKTENVKLGEGYARAHPDARPGEYVMMVVVDTGIGMTQEVFSHLFEPFFTTKEEGKGTGLGLATVYGIVTQSGGHIEVSSELSVGTTFQVYLPRVEKAVEPLKRKQRIEAAYRGTETVLLVEDEDMVRELANRTLQRYGYNVLGARHPGEALLLSEQHEGVIHLLVTDVVMPGMNGPKLAKRLTTSRPGMGVLYISGYMDDVIVRRGILDADVAFLHKPFMPVVLARKVREVLDAEKAQGAQ